MSGTRVLFVDRDGVLLEEPADEQVDAYEKFRLVRDCVPALRRLREAGFELVMVSNQDGLGSESFPQASFDGPQNLLLQVLASQGIEFREVMVDPHRPADAHPNRKPGVGMVLHYLRDRGVDLGASAMVGDRDTDMEFARALGVRGFRFGGEWDWPGIARTLLEAPRIARVDRRTQETTVGVEVDLDRSAPAAVQTGLGFFDHMLEQLGKHGGFALRLEVAGDLRVDEHHTVEDAGLALGQALRAAVGDKRGLGRYGFELPMDEARAGAWLDFSGRALFRFDGAFPREYVGDLPTELVPHFFRSLCDGAGINLHLAVQGENAHHMVEACFKACGRALRQALVRDAARPELPSTKGTL